MANSKDQNQSLELSETFVADNWKIRYNLFEPTQRPSTASHTPTKTIVFIHGTPWSSTVYLPLAKALLAQARYRVLLYDLPGYGLSQELSNPEQATKDARGFEGDTSVKAQAAALTALLEHLELDGKDGNPAPAVVAHDIAGTIALRAHLLHGCEFESLLFMDTNTVLPWGDGFYKLVRSQPEVFLQLPKGIFESVVDAVIRSAVFVPEKLASGHGNALREAWISENKDDGREKQKNFIRQIAQANDDDVSEMLDRNLYSEVRCDVKILWGEQDQWIPREKMEKLCGLLGDRFREFVVVPEAGHLVMIDQPERVAVEVFGWISRR